MSVSSLYKYNKIDIVSIIQYNLTLRIILTNEWSIFIVQYYFLSPLDYIILIFI